MWHVSSIWQIGDAGGGPPGINPGDLVQCVIVGGIDCTVVIDGGTPVRVVIESAIQIHVLTSGGTVIRVTI